MKNLKKKKIKIDKLKFCCHCGNKGMEIIDTCLFYDKYHICKKCGHCCFCVSKPLSPKEDIERCSKLKKSGEV